MELDMAGLAFEPKSLSMHAFALVTPLSGTFFCSFADFGSCLLLQDAALPCHMSLNAGKLQSCLYVIWPLCHLMPGFVLFSSLLPIFFSHMPFQPHWPPCCASNQDDAPASECFAPDFYPPGRFPPEHTSFRRLHGSL